MLSSSLFILVSVTIWASLVAQMVKNTPAMQETWVRFLGWEDPLKEGMATHCSILAWRIPMDRGAWHATVHGVTKSWTWQITHTHTHTEGTNESSKSIKWSLSLLLWVFAGTGYISPALMIDMTLQSPSLFLPCSNYQTPGKMGMLSKWFCDPPPPTHPGILESLQMFKELGFVE